MPKAKCEIRSETLTFFRVPVILDPQCPPGVFYYLDCKQLPGRFPMQASVYDHKHYTVDICEEIQPGIDVRIASVEIYDPFIRTKLEPRGWRVAWAVLRGRYRLTVQVFGSPEAHRAVFGADYTPIERGDGAGAQSAEVNVAPVLRPPGGAGDA